MTNTENIKKTFIFVLAASLGALMILSVLMYVTTNRANAQDDSSPDFGSFREDNQDKIDARVAAREERAQERIEAQRQRGEDREARTTERRQQRCEARVEKLESLMSKYTDQAERHLEVIDKIFERVQGFYASGQLTDPDYDALEEAVLTSQEEARTEVAALSELEVDIDCTDPEVAVSVSAFRGGTNGVKDSLKSYRTALVGLISSLRAQAAEDNAGDSTDDSANSETETESTEPSESETEQN